MSGPLLWRLSLIGLTLLLAAQLSVRIHGRHSDVVLRHSLYLPSGQYLRISSLGFTQLAADQLYVWSIQYYSDLRTDRWKNLYRMYDAMTDLDPRFVTAYLTGALILALEAGRYNEAIDLLEKGTEKNPERYVLPFEAAFYARSSGNLDRAAQLFDVAKRCPDAPPFVASWHAFVTHMMGDDREALRLWREAANSAPSEADRARAERHVRALTTRLELRRLDTVVKTFEAAEQRRPFSFAELVAHGYLTEVPRDPDGNAFVYDRTTGVVAPPVDDYLLKRYK